MRLIHAVFLLLLPASPFRFAGRRSIGAEPFSGDIVLHSTTNLVLVDVVITDKGKAVHGLDRNRSTYSRMDTSSSSLPLMSTSPRL